MTRALKTGRKGVERRAGALTHGAGGRVIPDAGARVTPCLRPKAVGAGGDPLPGWVWSPVQTVRSLPCGVSGLPLRGAVPQPGTQDLVRGGPGGLPRASIFPPDKI